MKTGLLGAAVLCAALALPIVAEAAEGYSTANVNMRSGPSTAYPAVTLIPAGAPVTINGCLAETPWCDVSFAGGRGWVAGRYVQVTYQQRRIYVGPEYYAPLGIPTIGFDLDNYWGRYYRGRDFYRDRDRWRHGPGWADHQDDSGWRRQNDRPGEDWRRRPDRGAGWQDQPDRNWDRQPDRRPDRNGQPDRNPDWDRQQNRNPDWDRRPDRNQRWERSDNDQNRPDRRPQPDKNDNQPRRGNGNAGPYSPDHVQPPGQRGYPCDNAASDCGPPPSRGPNR